MRTPGQMPVLQREGKRIAGDPIKMLIVRRECANALDVDYDVGPQVDRIRGNRFALAE